MTVAQTLLIAVAHLIGLALTEAVVLALSWFVLS